MVPESLCAQGQELIATSVSLLSHRPWGSSVVHHLTRYCSEFLLHFLKSRNARNIWRNLYYPQTLPPHLPLSWVCVQAKLPPSHPSLSLLTLCFPSSNPLLIHAVAPGWLSSSEEPLEKTLVERSLQSSCSWLLWKSPGCFLMHCSPKGFSLIYRLLSSWLFSYLCLSQWGPAGWAVFPAILRGFIWRFLHSYHLFLALRLV